MTHPSRTLERHPSDISPLTRRPLRVEGTSKTYLLLVAVIALHVMDDNFLQPQPGTSAGHHLLSGLVPLGLLTAVTAVSLVLPAGGRAVGALLAGAQTWPALSS